MTSAGGGWYRISGEYTVTGIGGLLILTANADNNVSYLGDVTKGIYIWGADLRVANDGVGLPPYQRVGAATNYDSVNFPYYLRFDGVDDCLFTSAINFTATDKMTAWAGVRKLSDFSYGVVCEISTNSDTTDGTFGFFNDASATPGYYIEGRASAQAVYRPRAYRAPVTNTISVQYNFAGANLAAQIIPRINSILEQENAIGTSVGTGNFGNYPLYIGRRGNTTLQWSGRLYSLIVRGTQSTETQITQTETWVNGKTKAY